MKRRETEKKIAILYICTGQYAVFWEQFYKSFQKRFLKRSHKEYFVFTDAEHLYGGESSDVHLIFQKRLGWPYDTLMKFEMFSRITDELNRFDYIFFFNSNSYCKRRITEKEFLPEKENLLFVQHPGMYNKPAEEYTYERDEKSLAYIPAGEGTVYVCGGINGGRTEAFLQLILELKHRIEEDEKRGVIAIYHDESHINRYVYEKMDYKLLSPAYGYPEGWRIPFPKKIILLDKSKYFNDRALKQGKR